MGLACGRLLRHRRLRRLKCFRRVRCFRRVCRLLSFRGWLRRWWLLCLGAWLRFRWLLRLSGRLLTRWLERLRCLWRLWVGWCRLLGAPIHRAGEGLHLIGESGAFPGRECSRLVLDAFDLFGGCFQIAAGEAVDERLQSRIDRGLERLGGRGVRVSRDSAVRSVEGLGGLACDLSETLGCHGVLGGGVACTLGEALGTCGGTGLCVGVALEPRAQLALELVEFAEFIGAREGPIRLVGGGGELSRLGDGVGGASGLVGGAREDGTG